MNKIEVVERPSKMTRQIGLDVVRACAICLVLVAHFSKALDYIGIYGVELFFALSGYLIGGILYRSLTKYSRWSFEEVKIFWLRRWWRTLPNYYLFLIISVPFHYYFGGTPTVSEGLPFLVFAQNLFAANSPFYGVSWSLCVEEWFYLLFPLCILSFTVLRLSRRTAFICTTLLFLVFPPVIREFLFTTHDPVEIRKMTIPRLDAIFYGVAMSFIAARYRASNRHRIALLLIASVGLLGLFIFQYYCFQTNDSVRFYRAAFLVSPICFSLILPFFASLERLPARFAFLSQPITNLSLWSYSIYLSHIPLLFLIYTAFGEAREHVIINIFSKVAGLLACLAVSGFIYTYFESRLMLLRPDGSRPTE